MPQPLLTHVNAVLTNIVEAYVQDEMNFVSIQTFPRVPVSKDTDFYYVFDREAFMRDIAQLRGDNEESKGSGFDLSTNPYQVKVWAFHKDLGEQTLARADDVLDIETASALYVRRTLLLRQEIEWVNTYFTTGVWGTTVTGGSNFTVWSDPNSDPEADIELGKATVMGATGFEPNLLVLGYNVFRHLRRHPVIKDQLKYTSSQIPTEDMLASFLGVDRVIVPKAVRATSIEGAATLTTGFTHGNHAPLVHAPSTPGMMTPSAGYTFEWTGVSQGLGATTAIDSFYIRTTRTQRVEGQIAFDFVLAGSILGYFFASAV